jgi:RNA polymerase sigma-70 factor (ECF subfamily)
MATTQNDLVPTRVGWPLPEDVARFVHAHRSEIVTHCYRMMGSLSDAEGVAQDVLALDGGDLLPGRTSVHFRIALRTLLFRGATKACLNELKARPRRLLSAASDVGSQTSLPGLSSFVGPFPDVLFDGPTNELGGRYTFHESITLEFIAALQYLSPYQRAVFILRDVLGWTAHEVAQQLERPVTSVNTSLHMARVAFQSVPRGREQADDPPSQSARRELMSRYAKAWVDGDAGALAELLGKDARLSIPPGACLRGASEVASFLRGRVFTRAGRRLVPTRSNGRDAFGAYSRSGSTTRHFEPQSIHVIELFRDTIRAIVCFPDPFLFTRFGLPAKLGRSWIQQDAATLT